jgi:putative ABC transport system permease protein
MRFLRRLKYLLRRGRREEELAAELAFHRALAEQEQRDAGLSPERARRAAARQMGNTTLAREDAHYVWFPAAVEGVLQDLRYAWRGLIRSRALLTVACLSLGLSTGFGTALFSVVNAVILQPVTAKRPDALVRFWVGDGNRISWLNLRDICDDTPGVSCSGYRIEELIWRQGDESVRLFGQAVSPNYFTMLGIEPLHGQVFNPETVRQTPDALVVTHAFWERQLGSDPNVVGRTLVLTGHPYTVIGVLPRGFRSLWGLGIAPSLYLPAGSAARPATSKRGDTEYELLGLLAPRQSAAEFRSRVTARAKALEAAYAVENRGFGRVQTFPFHRFGLFFSSNDPTMRVILLFASLILVIVILLAVVACVNVAGLLVARGMARQREIAIRLSIGCGRWRLARLLLAESLLLAVAGVGLGAAMSIWLARLLVAVPLPIPAPFEVEVPVDMHLLAYLTALVCVATVVVGVAPLAQAVRVSVIGGSGSTRTVGLGRWSLRAVLITVQVAISTLLLVSTTLFVRSLWASSQIDPGFDIDRVVTVEADTRSRNLKDAEAGAYYRAALDRLKNLPYVSAVSGASVVPLSMASMVTSLFVDRGNKDEIVTVNNNWILPDYFRAMGIPLRAGREFREGDRQALPRAAIVNETFARRLFPGRGALGQRVRRVGRPGRDPNPEPWAEIVAVVADSRYLTLGEEIRPQVYWPFAPDAANMTIHVRTERDPAVLARMIPEVLSGVDSRVPTRVRPLRWVMAVALFPAQAAAFVLAALGIVGWALTVTGLYGLVAYTMTRRIPELGVRVALGATPWSVMRLLLRDGLAITATGVATGLTIAWLVTPLLGTFLAGVSPRDLTSFFLVAAVLIVTALVASYGPARRGMSLSPTEALRNE